MGDIYLHWGGQSPLLSTPIQMVFSFESVLMRWMKLEPIIQSEVSQKDKDHYNILTHIYGIWKDVNNNPICRTEKKKRHRFIEQSFRLCGRRRGWDVSREQHRNMYSI